MGMNIEEKVINFKIAIKKGKSKDVVKYKFHEYLRCYDKLSNPSISQKADHRNLFFDYYRYMAKSEDGK